MRAPLALRWSTEESRNSTQNFDHVSGDISHVPLGLLENCLHACSARQLARIEDETRCIITLFCLTTSHPLSLQASINDQGSCFASMPLRRGHVGSINAQGGSCTIHTASQGTPYIVQRIGHAGRAAWTSRWTWHPIGSAAMSSALATWTPSIRAFPFWRVLMSPHLAEVITYTVCQLTACPVGGSTQRSAELCCSVSSGFDAAVRDWMNPEVSRS